MFRIEGEHFGSQHAVVLVGAGICNSVIHDANTPHNQLTCILPAGYSLNTPLIFIQSGGSVNSGDAQISYQQCPAGTYQDAQNIQCVECSEGFVSPIDGALTWYVIYMIHSL